MMDRCSWCERAMWPWTTGIVVTTPSGEPAFMHVACAFSYREQDRERVQF